MYEDLVAHGVQDVLKREYGDSLQANPDVCLKPTLIINFGNSFPVILPVIFTV